MNDLILQFMNLIIFAGVVAMILSGLYTLIHTLTGGLL